MHTTSALPLLLVEDSVEDCEFIMRALRKANMHNPILHCADGDDALDFLYHRGAYNDPHQAPRPGIILLDLNLPGTDGREVLEEIKQHDRLRTIPVVVLTTSSNPRDIEACYAAGANGYIQKPMRFDGLLRVIQHFNSTVFPGLM